MMPFKNSRSAWGALLLTVSCILGDPIEASAGPTFPPSSEPTATDRANRGVIAYEDGQYQLAAELLSQAYETLRVPSVGLWLARALTKLGRLVEASALYEQVEKLSPAVGTQTVQEKAQADAAHDLSALAPRIPRARVVFTGARPNEVRLTVDGREDVDPLRRDVLALNPGRHVIEARRQETVLSQTLELREGETKVVAFAFKSAPQSSASGTTPFAPAPSAVSAPSASTSLSPDATRYRQRRFIGWSALGLGAAGLSVGIVTGVLAFSKKNQLDDAGCVNGICPRNLEADVNTLNSLRTVSSVGFAVAGAGILAGATLLFLSRPPSSDSGISAWIGPGSAGIRGGF